MHSLPPLEDQVSAYTLDDIHNAKILLKLKGIDIPPDNDPRIAAVQDKDFDLCFFPNARLISDNQGKALLVSQQRESKRRRRDERMRACEYVWDHAKRRLRDERLWLQRRRDLEERRKVVKDREPRLQRNGISYDDLIQSVFQPPSPNVTIHTSPSWHIPSISPLSPIRSNSTRPMDSLRPVSFKDVLTAMEGSLFPLTNNEKQRRLSGKDNLRQAELLDSLLVKYDQRRMSKVTNMDIRSSVPLACKRCSVDFLSLTPSSSSSSISSCPSLTKSSSWLSYVSRSSEPKSPPTPPLPILSTWVGCSHLPVCRVCQQQSKRVPVPFPESPLHYVDMSVKLVGSGERHRTARAGRRRHLLGAASTIMHGLGHLVDAAKQLQKAYMTVAVCTAAELHIDDEDVDDYEQSQWKPVGARARSKDVKIFLGVTELQDSTPVQYIPLVSPYPPECPPHTILPNPLPYPIVFKPHPPVCRSPFRLADKESRGRHGARDRLQKLKSTITDLNIYDEANLRVRLVGNPAYLRLKALQNVLYERGFIWEGHGNDCGFSSGKETLHSVAVEGLGRSLLSVY